MSLLDRFREGSKYDSEGRFTLDEGRAKKKMARYQLTRLEEYLLLAVQAVVAAGTTSIQIDIEVQNNQQRVQLRANNTGLETDKLNRLEDFLFARSKEATPYYLLGVAVNAIEPSCLEEPNLVVNKKGELEFGTVLKRVFRNLESMLKKALRHCPASVIINGHSLDTDPLNSGPRQELRFDGTSSLTAVRYGVVIETKLLTNTPNYQAIVEEPKFSLDASFSHIVEDQVYEKLCRQLKKSANQMLTEMAHNFSGDSLEQKRLLNYLTKKLEQPARTALRNCDLFPLADSDKFCSLEDLETQYRQTEKVLFSDRSLNVGMRLLVVHRNSAWIREALNELYPLRALENAEAAYRRQLEAQRNKERWEKSERPTELAPGNYLITRQISGTGWQAEYGFSGSPGPSALDILYKGRLLCTESFKETLPPGAQAVLNFDEVEIDEMWTRATGRRYRSVLNTLISKLKDLFCLQAPLPQDKLYPELKRYLFTLLNQSKTPPRVARETSLFMAAGVPEVYSLKELQEWPVVLVGDYLRFNSELLIDQFANDTVIQYTPSILQVLKKRLGKSCIDYRETQAHLRRIERELRDPKPAKLEGRSEMMREDFTFKNVEGEIALLPDAGTRCSVTLLYEGVEIETLNKKMTKVLRAEVILTSPNFAPNKAWSEVKDSAFVKCVLAEVKTRLQKLEESFVSNELAAKWSYRIELLSVYPDAVKDHMQTPLFRDHKGLLRYSVSDVQEELAKRGHLLEGGRHLAAGDVVIFREFPASEMKFLRQVLGKVEVADAEKVIKTEMAQEAFWAREPQEVLLPAKPTLTLEAEVGSGVLGMYQHPDQSSGSLICYYRGREVTTKYDVLPSHWVGAVDSESFVLNDSCNNCKVSKEDLKILKGQCMLEMVKLLVHKDKQLLTLAKRFYVQYQPSGQVLKRICEASFLPEYSGEFVSPFDFDLTKKTWAYVGADFKAKVPTKRPILVLNTLEQSLLKALSNVPRLRNVEKDLLALKEKLDYLRTLPKELPKNLYSDKFEAGGLKAHIGMANESQIICLGPDGEAQGLVPNYRGLPVQAIVHGATLVKGGYATRPECELTGQARGLFKEWVLQLYLRWCQQVCHEFPSREDRAQALELLDRIKRELGSHQNHPLAAMANILWDLPLFRRSDRTYVSGSSIMAQATDSEEPVLVSDSRRGAPADCLIFELKSVEFNILVSVLGKKGIAWYERPPLIDTEQLKGSLRKAVGWGLSPFAAVSQAITKFAMERAARAEELKATSPEALEKKFLRKIRSDLGNLLGRKGVRRAHELFERPEMGSWIFGPPLYRSKSDGRYRFNRQNANIRWLVHEAECERAQRVARYLLIVHWVAEVNVLSEELTDEHEDEFLLSLTERMAQTFGNDQKKK